jgi:hypothetical protein
MAMHVVPDRIRSDETRSDEVRSSQIGSGQVTHVWMIGLKLSSHNTGTQYEYDSSDTTSISV